MVSSRLPPDLPPAGVPVGDASADALRGRVVDLEGEVARLTLRVRDLQQQRWGRKAERGRGATADGAAAWERERNAARVKVTWRFTTDAARHKLARLYPALPSSSRWATTTGDGVYLPFGNRSADRHELGCGSAAPGRRERVGEVAEQVAPLLAAGRADGQQALGGAQAGAAAGAERGLALGK